MKFNRRTFGSILAGIAGCCVLPAPLVAKEPARQAVYGLQSVGITTTFNLEQVFTTELRKVVEDLPIIDLKMEGCSKTIEFNGTQKTWIINGMKEGLRSKPIANKIYYAVKSVFITDAETGGSVQINDIKTDRKYDIDLSINNGESEDCLAVVRLEDFECKVIHEA